jgi:hypothetical protein
MWRLCGTGLPQQAIGYEHRWAKMALKTLIGTIPIIDGL